MNSENGGDPKRVTYPAHPGASDATRWSDRPRVAIAGGGIAGLTAATALAERGVRVELFEQEEYVGGRVGGWPTRLADGSDVTMSRGFHAFFRQYYNLRKLLRRADGDGRQLSPLSDYPLRDAAGRTEGFRGLPRTPLLNALIFALRSSTFRWRDLPRLNARAALPLATVDVPGIYQRLDHIDASAYLDQLNFPSSARHLAFEVFSRSFFAPPEEMSAAELATMFHLYFLGTSEGLVFDVPSDTFPAVLWEPLLGYLRERDVSVHPGTVVTGLERSGARRFRVHTGDGASDVDGVVLAPDINGLRGIVENSPSVGTNSWRAAIAGMRTAPPYFVRRLWLDRPVEESRPAFLGIGNQPPLDNISVLNHYEAEAAAWARERGGSVVELHAYAVTGDTAGVPAQVRERLHENYPETGHATVIDERSVWHQDCPHFGPGDFAARPPVRTPESGLVLAGDGIRVDLPVALMERAATTGWVAANQLLESWGLAGHAYHSVPNHGRFALMRGLTRLQGG